MWNVHPQSVTHCQRRLAAKFQFIDLLTETDMHIMKYPLAVCGPSLSKPFRLSAV